jgi:APA family basic amino acid/polyamine antiporter
LSARPTERRLDGWTATSLVVSSMVGTGVFTTTGLLARDLPSAPAILACWAVGGLASLCGALAYAELAVAMPDNGGEYRYLARLFHPVLGFLSAWCALVVGFAAPLAALALGFGSYLAVVLPGVPPVAAGAALVVATSLLHAWRVSVGARAQDLLTLGNVLLVAGFVAVGAGRGACARLLDAGELGLGRALRSPEFAVGLLWISYSYTGWSAAAYVGGEVRDPARTLPRALLGGTALVTLLYVALNAVFLAAAPLGELEGKLEVGHVAARALLGDGGGRVLSGVIAMVIVATVSAIAVTGPRIYEAVGRDFPRFGRLGARAAGRGPAFAIALQAVLALTMMATASFEALLSYIGFTLSLFSALAVAGVFRLERLGLAGRRRVRGHRPAAVVFLVLMAWMALHAIVRQPLAVLAGLATLGVGLVLYAASGRAARS